MPGPAPTVAVLWDMDGVLVDSEPLLFEAERLTFAPYGIDLTLEQKKPFIGLGGHEIMAKMADAFGVDADSGDLGEAKLGHVVDLLGAVTGFAPTTALVRSLAARGIPMAVASGSSPEMIQTALTAVGLAEHLPTRVSVLEVERGKPAPDVFLAAADRLGVAPERCVVIEDAVPGVLAAKDAGMRCIAIPYVTDPWDDRFDVADLVVRGGMAAADPNALLDWITARSRRTAGATSLVRR
ncbi:HAD family hydrolase [Microbacterium thalassium]|uniref:Beta-phosphoglucomutase-like phosphatase (HAD superfamily) n=1 Tax=Microbacterium thalassium TaxID=362649 RepID=A0A7X0FNF2_9MICO|nr:HAD family phosphatase [Microbacterium thalassium]MBB6390191.1 beta-phosphoglucomutase-like phosphatase (HAD superfamily) [Microbacterium thalassium]GLK25299.1 hydrolase [Microbacterium thalassium]